MSHRLQGERATRVSGWALLVSCAIVVSTALWSAASAVSAQGRRPQQVNNVRLYVFDLGTLKVPDPSNLGTKKEQPRARISRSSAISWFTRAEP